MPGSVSLWPDHREFNKISTAITAIKNNTKKNIFQKL
jgi:hypothetical protein